MEQVWVISDPRDEYFGVTVTQDIETASELMVEGGSKCIVEYEDEHRLDEQCGQSKVVDTVKKWRAADSDVRIFKMQRDAAGNRNRPLADSVPPYTQEDMKDLPHTGARAFREASDGVSRTSQN